MAQVAAEVQVLSPLGRRVKGSSVAAAAWVTAVAQIQSLAQNFHMLWVWPLEKKKKNSSGTLYAVGWPKKKKRRKKKKPLIFFKFKKSDSVHLDHITPGRPG